MNKIKLMEVCGTHTMAIAKSGIKAILPESVELVSGPGCPVCVTSQSDIDKAIAVSGIKDVIIATFGDMMRVPGEKESLAQAKSRGKDIRMVYSCMDALSIAKDNPKKRIVFIGVGFETTSPTVAATIMEAKRQKINNFFVLSCFKLIPPALYAVSNSDKVKIDGFICPGHVSVIIGTGPYEKFAACCKKPCVIAGFEDTDILVSIKRLVEMIKARSYKAEIEYKRAVTKNGNTKARKILASVFDVAPGQWRGIGIIEKSALKINKRYASFDAEKEFDIKISATLPKKGCMCGEVIQGIIYPNECKLFKRTCTPRNPKGPCMVSSEGACAAYYRYGK
ncbi:MAG: hydrogenase formation protein HypD [Candidatus Omnitrophica bacterium]|nr:hydrogenase formation protein HypD [Candidatus Omnitrophota bacterium]